MSKLSSQHVAEDHVFYLMRVIQKSFVESVSLTHRHNDEQRSLRTVHNNSTSEDVEESK